MKLTRCTFAAGIILLGAAGVVLSFAGVVGAWSLRASLSEKVGATFDRIGSAVGRIEELLGRVLDRLQDARHSLRELEQGLNHIRGAVPKLDAETRTRLTGLATRFVTGIEHGRTRLADLVETARTINKLLEAARVLAPGRIGELDTALFAEASALLGHVSAAAGELSDRLNDFLVDRLTDWALEQAIPRLVARADHVTDYLARVRDSTANLAGELPRARDRGLGWLRTAAVVATILLLWMSLAQVALLTQGVRWWRPACRAARSRQCNHSGT